MNNAVRLQGAPDLHQRAGKIVDRMQRQHARHQIEAAIGEGQGFLIGDDTEGRSQAKPVRTQSSANGRSAGKTAARE